MREGEGEGVRCVDLRFEAELAGEAIRGLCLGDSVLISNLGVGEK